MHKTAALKMISYSNNWWSKITVGWVKLCADDMSSHYWLTRIWHSCYQPCECLLRQWTVSVRTVDCLSVKTVDCLLIGGDIWIDGKERKGGVYTGADEAVPGQERLCENSDNQQKDQHQVLWRRRCSRECCVMKNKIGTPLIIWSMVGYRHVWLD